MEYFSKNNYLLSFLDGHFSVAVSNGESKSITSTMINCYRVLVKKQNDKLTITSLSLPSFFLCEGAGRDIADLKVTHLKWVSSSSANSSGGSEDALLVGTKCSAGSFLELWGLVEKSTPIHRQFQTQNKTEIYKKDVSAYFWCRDFADENNLYLGLGTSS